MCIRDRDTGMSDAVSYLAANKENKVSGSWTMTGSDGAVDVYKRQIPYCAVLTISR